MDLKAVLASNKAKVRATDIPRKPVYIAVEDRPYSVPEVEPAFSETENKQPPSPIQLFKENTDAQSPGFVEKNSIQASNNATSSSGYPNGPVLNGRIKQTGDKRKEGADENNTNQNPASIAEQERPYSSAEISSIQPYKTSNKPATNWQQSSNKVATEPATNQQQTGNKVATENGNWQQSGNTTSNNTRNKVATNWQQTGNKVATKTAFSSLVGLQRDIVVFICHECKNSRSKTTEELTLEYIAKCLKRGSGAVRTTIQRLEKKGFLSKTEFKNGRGGWSRYAVTDDLYHEVLRSETGNKLATNWQQTGNKVATQLATQLATTPSSSSGSNLNTTTTGDGAHDLPPDWQMFDFSPLEEFGFGKSHLLQIQRRGLLNPQIVQESVNAFAFDLKRNQKAKTLNKTPLEFFMGILCKGSPYAPPENYESPREEAMRLYTERLQSLKEKREKTEKLAMELAFDEWFSGLTLESQKKIFPSMLGLKNEVAKKASFMHHFRENIWPEERGRNGG